LEDIGINIKDRYVMIVGAGGTVKEYKDKIVDHIKINNIITIGINLMTFLCIPDYHLWTNKQRYATQHDCISKKSKLLFGCRMPENLIKKHWDGDFERVDYVNESDLLISYKDGCIYGNFRTAGILAIMIAYINGAKKIEVVGMDGFTLYDKIKLDNKEVNHHCYGSGYTDDASWEKCVGKDKLVDDGLHALKDYGVDFKILTPTKFEDFYDSNVLGII